MKLTQKERVLNYLQKGKTLTHTQALRKLAVGDLAGAVRDLKKLGHNITMTMTNGRNRWFQKVRYGVYRLEV